MKPRVLIVRVQGKCSPVELQSLTKLCDIIVINLFRPEVDEKVLSVVRKCTKCDVAVFTTSLACYILHSNNIPVEAKYYVAIGDDTRDSIHYLLGVPRENIATPHQYSTRHVVELVRKLVEQDREIRVVHVYRSQHAENNLSVKLASSLSRKVIIREFKLYRLTLDRSLVPLLTWSISEAKVLVLLSALPALYLIEHLGEIKIPVVVPSERVKKVIQSACKSKIYVMSNVTKEELIRRIMQALEDAEHS